MANKKPVEARLVSQDFWSEVGGERVLVQERTVFRGADEGSVLPHRLGTPHNLLALQRTVESFVQWADTRFTPRCPSMFLAAASVCPEGLRTLLQTISRDVCLLAPPMHVRPARHPKEAHRIKDETYWAICRTLNGFILVDELFLGADKTSGRWDTKKSLREVSHGLRESPLSVAFREWFLEQAAPTSNDAVAKDKERLFSVQPRRRQGNKKTEPHGSRNKHSTGLQGVEFVALDAQQRQMALCEGLRLAVHALDGFLERDLFARGGCERHPMHRRFASQCRRIHAKANHPKHIKRTADIAGDAVALVSMADGWISDCLPLQKRGHVANQSKARSLRRHVAYVYQYAILIDAHRRLDKLLDVLVRMRILCERLIAQLRTLSKREVRGEKKTQRRKPRDFDRMVLRPGVVDEWLQSLGKDAKAVGALCEAMASKRISGPWGRGDHVELFFAKGKGTRQRVGDGKPIKARSERRPPEAFVEDLLVPMQAAGLAAQAPWDYLWDRASNPKARLKSHRGKKWVINPFGLLLAAEEAG